MKWAYKLNVNSTDTLGGRVIQLLSVNIQSVTWEGEAGTKEKLVALTNRISDVMNKHVDTQRAVRLEVPTRGWVMDVYVRSMPGIGWKVDTVAYPYRLIFEVVDDYGTISGQLLSRELARLAEGIGYDPAWHGGIPVSATQGTPKANGSGNGQAFITNRSVPFL